MVYSPLLNHSSFFYFHILLIMVSYTHTHTHTHTHRLRERETETERTTDLGFMPHSAILGMSLYLTVKCKSIFFNFINEI